MFFIICHLHHFDKTAVSDYTDMASIDISFTLFFIHAHMINSSEIIQYTPEQIGFDGAKYIELQAAAIRERMSKFAGRLYLEIGGKFLYDPHAARVLP